MANNRCESPKPRRRDSLLESLSRWCTGHTEWCIPRRRVHVWCTGHTEWLITTLSCNACTNFIGSAVLCWARGCRYVAKPAHFNSWVPRGVKSIGPATQFAIHLSNGTPLNDVAGALKYWPWRAKRTPSLSNHFHLTIPRVHKVLPLPIKTSLIVKWIRF